MRLHQLAAGIAVAALIPSFAMAQASCEQRQTNRAVGTIAGAGIGALLGSAVAGHGDRTAGAVVGGLGGALAGNQLAKSHGDCAHAYGYYDNAGAWHASNVARTSASGYYDREGEWVDGAPNGHYDQGGRWVRTSTEPAAAGYYDNAGRFVPASANGYYDNQGRWVAGAAGGHYDTSGRWVAGASNGRYDANGRWIPGRTASRTEVQPGYYEQGRWHAEEVYGYYDTNGRWTRIDNTGYQGRGNAPMDVRGRQTWLDQRIRRGMDEGTMTRAEGGMALRRLSTIQRETRNLSDRNGNLRPRSEQLIMAKLDRLTDDVREMRRGPVRQY